jgi:hypothetical protein
VKLDESMEDLHSNVVNLSEAQELEENFSLVDKTALQFDRVHPRCLYKLSPPQVREKLEELENNVDLMKAYSNGEYALRGFLNTKKIIPTPLDVRVRYLFWSEYTRVSEMAVRRGKVELIKLGNISGWGAERIQVNSVMRDIYRFAFVVTPLVEAKVIYSAVLDQGMSRLEEIVNIPFYDNKGKFDPRAASIVLKAIDMLDVKLNGPKVQRVDVRSVNVNVNEDDYKKRVEELKRELGQEVSTPLIEDAPRTSVEDAILSETTLPMNEVRELLPNRTMTIPGSVRKSTYD